MASTIKLKNGSGAPTAGDLVQGEPALDLTNKRLYTEDAGGTVVEVGTNPTALTIGGTALTATATEINVLDGITATTAELNILDGVTATTAELNYTDGVTSNIQTQLNTKAPIDDATFTGTTTIPTADINAGTIDDTVIGGTTAAAVSATTLSASSTLSVTGEGSVSGLTVGKGAGDVSTNTAVGKNALVCNTTGSSNTANGFYALRCNTTGIRNTASGVEALRDNTTGSSNTANGFYALLSNTTGDANTANGRYALFSNTTGACNTANGRNALFSNTTGSSNTANGYQALLCNTTGSDNTANGFYALLSNTTGDANTANGRYALVFNTTGANNIGIGANAGRTGYSPLAITTASNQVIIGNNNHNCFVAGCAFVTSSDCRDKTDVSDTPYGLDFVLALQPVEYKWDKRSKYGWDEESQSYVEGDGSKKDAHCSLGFLAQQVLEVEKQIAPHRNSIIVSEDDPLNLNMGETRIIPALVKAIQEQQATILALTARLEALENN